MKAFSQILALSCVLSVYPDVSAHCQAPLPAPTAPQASSSPAPADDSNSQSQAPRVVFHHENLNLAFALTTQDYDSAIRRGQDLARKGKPLAEVFKAETQMPRGVKGEKGKSHESSVVCTTLNADEIVYAAYQATNNYTPLRKPFGQTVWAGAVHFFVNLNSVPKVGATVFDSNRLAGEQDVQVTKFVLTDDKGNIINPLLAQSAGGVQSGSMNFSGVNRINHTDTAESNAQAVGSDGAYGFATGTSTYRWTQYMPWSESHPYYSAAYNVSFPLFDKEGQPLLKTDAKSMTLHIITPNGEKDVTYDLHPPKF